jgi:uncharacterized protein YqjF (DUF2071 family)
VGVAYTRPRTACELGAPRRMSHPSFAHVAHRPWPLPDRPWRWAQVWEDLAFLHWPVPARDLRAKIPLSLEIEEHAGTAWLGIVPFRLRIRPRGLPALPRIGIFPEINVRTYVTADGRPGVWFFSLDAPSRLAVAAARRLFRLPYRRARFSVRAAARAGDWVDYRAERLEPPAAAFAARYRSIGAAAAALPGSLDHFLAERYCFYAADPAGRLHRAEVHHPPWRIAPAEVEIEANSLTAPLGLPVEGAPRAAYARRLEVATWALEPVRSGPSGRRGGG